MVTGQPISPISAGGTATFKLKTKPDTVPPVPVGFEKQCAFTVNIDNDDPDENPYNFTITVTLRETS